MKGQVSIFIITYQGNIFPLFPPHKRPTSFQMGLEATINWALDIHFKWICPYIFLIKGGTWKFEVELYQGTFYDESVYPNNNLQRK